MPPKSTKKETTAKQPAKSTPASTNGTTTPVSSAATDALPHTTSKPDKKAFDSEQDQLKSEIDTLQTKLNAVRDKISLATKNGPGKERREVLKKELNDLKGDQGAMKRGRDKIHEQLQSVRASMEQKKTALNTARGKTPFKTVADVDNHIRHLESQVESGSMKLADEKRALQEITQTKRTRKTVEGFQRDQEAIEADKRTLDELKKQLDDPEAKAASEKYTKIKEELDALKKEEDEAYAGRSQLFSERDGIQAQLNELYNKKRAGSAAFREQNDRYWTKVNEERSRRAERARAQRAADEAEKKKEEATRLREEAEIPAYQAYIEDCQTLIDSFSGKTTGAVKLNTAPAEKAELAGVSKLDIRQVEAPTEGVIVRKKKGEDDDNYFVASKKQKNQKGSKPPPSAPKEPKEPSSSDSALNVPLATLTALLSLSIPPPASSADVPRVIEDLKTKKAWYEANQARATAENIAKADAAIARLMKESSDILPPNGNGEHPAEPAPTPATNDDVPSAGVPADVVDEKLETVVES
ncbi:hypothetical protein DL96DRAFT_983543 [Flagelloscypha sp. PMI_526]|nr:hypothetical protein DL96DRAFT_983543 [Flagelloscypha sp. PMI_526]